MKKNIAKWRKLAVEKIDKSLPNYQYEKLWRNAQAASERVRAYDRYKLILEPKSLANLKKYLAKNKPHLTIMCLHGDLQNVCVQYQGKWCQDNTGKIFDADCDDQTHMWCTEHEEGSVVHIEMFIEDVEEISEFQEVVKLLRKCKFA